MNTRWFGTVGLLLWVPWACGSPRLSVLHSFGTPESSAAFPSAALVEASNGALYGTAASGGAANAGAIFRVNKDGSGFQILKSFGAGAQDGRRPLGSLIEGTDGALYGTTEEGGEFELGTAFRLNKDGSGFMVLRSFDGDDGANPVAGLLAGSDGLLYGTTPAGGDTNGNGVVFRMTTNGADFTVLAQFTGTNGAGPEGALIELGDGMLYGTTYAGGQSNLGTVFRLYKDDTGVQVLKHFTVPGADGQNPLGALAQGSMGRLYGIASGGGSSRGSNAVGAVFSLNQDGSDFLAVAHFGTNLAKSPLDGLRQGSDGMLYGAASSGGTNNSAVLYRVEPASGHFQVLTNLPASDGPPFALIEASDGLLYGTTQFGGKTGAGTVFRVGKDGSELAVLLNLDRRGGDGESGYAALTPARDGRLYGTTRSGGREAGGTIFSIKPTGQGYRQMFDLGASSGGCEPVSPLLEGRDGLLYGSTAFGGTSNRGTLFRLERAGSGYTTLHDAVTGTAGYGPRAALIQHGEGALFGVMSEGGASSPAAGTLFELDPNNGDFTSLLRFMGSMGANPLTSLTFASDGYLHGTMAFGFGSASAGTIFRVATNGVGYVAQVTFSLSDDRGANPASPLLLGRDGMFYGAAYGGGPTNNAGTIFRVNPDGTGFQVLHGFTSMAGDGRHPCGQLTQTLDGTIFGTTESGGANGMGTLYSVSPDGNDYTVLANFDEQSGKYPRGGLVALADGSLLGTTDQGGEMDLGTVFRFGSPLEFIDDVSLAEGQVVLTCVGQAGFNYAVERTGSPATDGAWEIVQSTNAPASGRFQVFDQTPPPQTAFYRMRR